MASNKKRKQTQNQPSVNEFHDILLKLSSGMEMPASPSHHPIRFSKGGVMALREAYLGYLQQVSSTLVLHDKIPRNDTSIVETACSCNGSPEFVEFVRQAKDLLENAPSDPKKQRRRQQKASKITSDMQAEQERLLFASKRTMLLRRQEEQQEGKHTHQPDTQLEK